MKKRIVALFMASLISVMMVTGCGAKEKQEADNTTAVATEAVTDSKTATDDKSADAAATDAVTTDTTKDAAATDAEEGDTVDVGGDYPVSTKYDEYQLVDYYFGETDQTIKMVVSRTTDAAEYDVHFTFFNDEQELQFTVKDNVPTATFDKSGFITKDIENIYKAIQESNNWTAVQK